MLFLPYKADIDLPRVPIVTIIICVTCVAIHIWQHKNDSEVIDKAYEICAAAQSHYQQLVFRKTLHARPGQGCAGMLYEIHTADEPEAAIRQLIQGAQPLPGLAKADSDELAYQTIRETYMSYARIVPSPVTPRLWYEPQNWNVWRMITSTFTHADWFHVIGNLFFFIAFAATVENIIGSFRFVAVVLGITIFTSIFFSFSMNAIGDTTPTVGLSGVAMGIIALFAFFLPKGRIWCFFWFLIYFRRFTVPAWIFATWYVGWDLYALFSRDSSAGIEASSGVDFVSHVTGAIAGYMIGFLLFRDRKIALHKPRRTAIGHERARVAALQDSE